MTARASAHSPWLVANLLAQISFGLLAMTLCLPSMQEWGGMFGTDQAHVQLTFSGYLMAYGFFQLVYGPLSDRHGRKVMLIIGLAIAGAASVMAMLAQDITTLTLARVLQGAGSAASMVVGRSMVQDLFEGPARTRVMAYIGMSLGLCPPLASLLGGQVHVRWGWQTNFAILTALAVLLLLAAWRGLPKHRRVEAQQEQHWLCAMGQAYRRLFREPRFLLYVVILAATTAAFYVFLGGAPIVLSHYGIGPDGVGWFIMTVPLAYIVGNFLTSRTIHRAGERRMMRWGQVFTLSGIVLMLALGLADIRSPLAVALPLLLTGFGHGLLNPPALAGTVGVIPALAGSAAAVAGLMQQITGATGGYLIGLVPHDSVSMGALMLAFSLLALAAQLWLHRRA
jgi:DHA1 family bicyclomycin/chloramphenicol resistance-like MFS transporter